MEEKVVKVRRIPCESFCLGVNENHYSNETESLKCFNEVIVLYLTV